MFTFTPGEERKLDGIVADLFGPSYDWTTIEATDPEFAETFAFQVGEEGFEPLAARSYLRGEMMRIRPVVSAADLESISLIYRDWLDTARVQGPEMCRDIVSKSFSLEQFEPGKAVLEKERELARRFLDDRSFLKTVGATGTVTLNSDVVGEVLQRTGLTADELGPALFASDGPARCEIRIALIDVLIPRDDENSLKALAAL